MEPLAGSGGVALRGLRSAVEGSARSSKVMFSPWTIGSAKLTRFCSQIAKVVEIRIDFMLRCVVRVFVRPRQNGFAN